MFVIMVSARKDTKYFVSSKQIRIYFVILQEKAGFIQ